MANENNRQRFLEVKQKLDFYHLPTSFPIEATQLILKILNKLDMKTKYDTDRTRQSNHNVKELAENQKIINFRIRQLITENNKLHKLLVQSSQQIQLLKDCFKANQKQKKSCWEMNVINSLKARQLQLFQELTQTKFKYNQLMDLIHQDPTIQKKYLKRLLKHKKLTIQNPNTEDNIENKATYKSTDQKSMQKQELQKFKLVNKNLFSKIQNRELQILRLQKLIQNQLNLQTILKNNQAKKNKQQLNNLRYQNDLLINKLTSTNNKTKSKQKVAQQVTLQKIKSPKKTLINRQNEQKKSLSLLDKIVKLQEIIKQKQEGMSKIKKQLQTVTKQLKQYKIKEGQSEKIIGKGKINFENQILKDKYKELNYQQIEKEKQGFQNQLKQNQKKVSELTKRLAQTQAKCHLLNKQTQVKSQAIKNLEQIITELSQSLKQQPHLKLQQQEQNLKHKNIPFNYPPKPLKSNYDGKISKDQIQKQKKQRKGSLDSIKKTDLKTTNVLTTQVKGTLKQIEQQNDNKRQLSRHNLSQFGDPSENMQLDIKSDFYNNYPSNIHSKITEFKKEGQSSKQNSNQNNNFKISVKKAGEVVGQQFLYKQDKNQKPKFFNKDNQNNEETQQKTQKMQILRQKTAQQAIKNIKKQQKQTYQQLQIQPQIDSSDKASVFSMRKQIDDLKVQNRKEAKLNKKMEKQIKDLQQQRDRFSEQIKILEQKNNKLIGGDFSKIIKEQQNRISELQQNNIQTELKIKDKDIKISNLQVKIQTLSQKIQNLTSNLQKLQEQNHQLKKQREKLLEHQKQYVDIKNQQLNMKIQNQQKQNRNNSLEYSSQILWLKKQIKNLQEKIQKYTQTINELNDFVSIHRKEKEKLSIEKIGYLKQNQYLKKKLIQLERALTIQAQCKTFYIHRNAKIQGQLLVNKKHK